MDALSIVEQCYNHLPENIKEKPWKATDHGRKVLETEDELNAYIAAYGEMHIVKCRAALQNFPFEDLEMYPYEIFDWGCGQGLATLCLLDMLHDRGKLSHLKRIYLIEPSNLALTRATKWVKQNARPGIKIISINSYIPNDNNATMPNVSCSSEISINLFSNILDIRNLNLAWLAKKTASLANTNYMVCIGPKFTQNTNTRIADFCGYFKPDEYFSNINSYPYAYTNKTHHAYGCETKCFVHHKTKAIDSQYKECAAEYDNSDPYDYASEILSGLVDDKTINFYNKLRQECGTSYDVFFRPAINCDTVDFVLASKSHGILLINICQSLEKLEEAFNRIEAIKSNIFTIHLRTIKIDSIIHPSVYNCVKTALFFPNHSLSSINEKIDELNLNNKNSGNRNHYAYLYKFTESSNFRDELSKITSRGFKSEYYDELINLISSNWHSYKDGDIGFHLSPKQTEIVRSNEKRIRVKGVAGCGKTQVVANRAVEQHLKTGERVLILTFNISLIQYIRMRINQVPADFAPNMFEIINYHQFFKSKANQYADQRIYIDNFDDSEYFKPYANDIKKYSSIIIDEVQDFKTEWITSIVRYFLKDNGSISIFGDGEQNIYDRDMDSESKMPSLKGCGFPSGKWLTMNERISMRFLNPKIATLSSKFAYEYLANTDPIGIQNEIIFEKFHVKYWKIDHKTKADTIARNILWIISEYCLKTDDIVVLAQSINLLRDIEAAYVRGTNLRTMINFETASQYEKVTKDRSSAYIQKDLEEIRRAAKTHFTTDCSAIKMSTIHSFKGWESKTIILILQPEMQPDDNFDSYGIREDIPALIYTALTRAKCNLFVLNLSNPNYHDFFIKNINN